MVAVRPPSTTMFAPLTNDAASDARNSTTGATSSGVPWRPKDPFHNPPPLKHHSGFLAVGPAVAVQNRDVPVEAAIYRTSGGKSKCGGAGGEFTLDAATTGRMREGGRDRMAPGRRCGRRNQVLRYHMGMI